MKKTRRDNPTAPLPAPMEGVERVAWIMPAALCAGFVYYPEKAYPPENLGLCAVLALAALAGGIGCFIAGGNWRARWLAGIGRGPVLACAALALWALARWSAMDVQSSGTEWVLGLLWMSVAAAFGVAVSSVSESARRGAGEDLLVYLRRFFVVAAIAAAAHAFYQYFIGMERALSQLNQAASGSGLDAGVINALREKRVTGTLGNPNLFAAQLAMLAAFCIGSLGPPEKLLWRALGVVGWAMLTFALVLTASRGGMLTFAFVTVVGIAAIGWSWRRGLVRSPVITFCILLSAVGAHAAGDGLLERLGNITTVRERLFYWEIAAKIWAEHPIVGGGPGRFALLYASLKSPLARESQYAHSWVMQTGADLGLIGVVIYLVFWGGLAWMAWRAINSRGGSERFWPLLALLALCFNGLFEFSLQWRAFLVPAGLLAGLACGAEPAVLSRARRARGMIGSILMIGALAAALIVGVPWHIAVRHDTIRYEWMSGGADASEIADAMAKASSWQPRDSGYVLNEARARMALGQTERARELLGKAAALNPYSAAVHATHARLLIERIQPIDALAEINQALKRYPSNLEYRMMKARILLSLERDAEARDVLESIEADGLPMYPEDRDALDRMRVSVGLKAIGR